MKTKVLVGVAFALALVSGAANAETEKGSKQFRSDIERNVAQNGVVLMERKKNNVDKAYKYGAASAFGGAGAGGLLGSTSTGYGNFSQIVVQNTTNNNCQAAAGGTLTCGSGSVSGGTNTVGQTTQDSTVSADTTVTGNTVTSKPVNQTNTSTNGSVSGTQQ